MRNESSKWKKNDGAWKRLSDELQRRSGSISRSSGVGWTKNDRAQRRAHDRLMIKKRGRYCDLDNNSIRIRVP